MLIDSHCHLTDPAFAPDRDAAVARMRVAGVERAVVVESQLAQLDATAEWVGCHAGLSIATGCHPHDASRWDDRTKATVMRAWALPLVVAAGEMGLDYHYDFSPRDVQRRAFAEQCALAVDAGMPIVVHAREADADVAAVLTEHPGARIILHSFSSGPVLLEAALEHRWFLSFSGMVTFKSWHQDDAVRHVAADRLLIETDAPYLAPVPRRGDRNEPAFLPHVAARVAAARGVTADQIARETSANATGLFWPGE